jgi:hypothetical protein
MGALLDHLHAPSVATSLSPIQEMAEEAKVEVSHEFS